MMDEIKQSEIKVNSVKAIENQFLVQQELHVPKGQYNQFSNFNYRSYEDIMHAVKPILGKYKLTIHATDKRECDDGGWHYIESTVSLLDFQGNSISGIASAREPETKKGMDVSQISGSTSSYARKLALCGLLAIDNNRDIDSIDNSEVHP